MTAVENKPSLCSVVSLILRPQLLYQTVGSGTLPSVAMHDQRVFIRLTTEYRRSGFSISKSSHGDVKNIENLFTDKFFSFK